MQRDVYFFSHLGGCPEEAWDGAGSTQQCPVVPPASVGTFPFSELDLLQAQCLAFLGILLPPASMGDEVAKTDFVVFKAPFLIVLKYSWGASPRGWSVWREGRDLALGVPWINETVSRSLGGHSSLALQPHWRFARRYFDRFCLVTVRHKPCV